MKLTLTGPMELAALRQQPQPSARHERLLRVLFCGICRTDARMWRHGHRDLVLPRVLGHEIAAFDETAGKLCTVWPGLACGSCSHCLGGRENLCEAMRIMGFHEDGGFASHLLVPTGNIIHAENIERPESLCFAEPLACLLHACRDYPKMDGTRLVVYGGGVLGLLAAMLCRRRGAEVTVVERNGEKIEKASDYAGWVGISICQATAEKDFDFAINCCDSPEAFEECIIKLKKGGHLFFFSGLAKKGLISGETINLVHYRELTMSGSYGPERADMHAAVRLCRSVEHLLVLLIEEVIEPAAATQALSVMQQEMAFKYIIRFVDFVKSHEDRRGNVVHY